MARQILKGLTMLLMTLALAAASAAIANGQSKQKLIAHVPFDFVVAEKTFRSGEYDVRAANQAGAIVIKSVAGDKVLRLSSPKERRDRRMDAKLVFHRYGNTY